MSILARAVAAFGLGAAGVALALPPFPPHFEDVTIGSGWDGAVGMTFAADGRMFVWEKAGRVWIVDDGVKAATPLIDIAPEVGNWRDHGLLGFALDPDFLTNGHIYLLYAVDYHHLTTFGTSDYNPNTNTYFRDTIGRLTRYTCNAGDDFASVDLNSRTVLLGESIDTGIPLVHQSHGTGSLVFGADGTLLISVGDGASYSTVDTGGPVGGSSNTALADGIIRPKEDIGAFRSQLIDSHNGKILRIDPATGDGVPSNPFYDAAAPRAPRSRVWALGLRNPYRMCLRPGTGSTVPADAAPGTLLIGDVGWMRWEEINVCRSGGQNFGWPLFEGMTTQTQYAAEPIANQDAPNPLNGTMPNPPVFCSIAFFRFRDLLIQDTQNPWFPNPCDPGQSVPASIPTFVHERPAIDYFHQSGSVRTPIYYPDGNAGQMFIDEPNSPVQGPQFGGTCAVGGAWYDATSFPAEYQGDYFFADFTWQWIKRMRFDAGDNPVEVLDFSQEQLGPLVAVGVDPVAGDLYYISYDTIPELHRVRYVPNLAPVVVAVADVHYGSSPLTVQLTGSGSSDPEESALTYEWDFGDGSPISTEPDPVHVFGTPELIDPTPYTVTLTVRDENDAEATTELVISVNNTPPVVEIISPVDGSTFPDDMDVTVPLTATISDAEHGPAERTCRWQTILHHNEHTHPEPFDFNCNSETVLSPHGVDGDAFFYEITLTVTDAAGLATTDRAFVYPQCQALHGDLDNDGNVDNDDVADFRSCYTGAGNGPVAPQCQAADTEPDGDVDCTDWAAVRASYQCSTGQAPIPAMADFVGALLSPQADTAERCIADLNKDGATNGADVAAFIGLLTAAS